MKVQVVKYKNANTYATEINGNVSFESFTRLLQKRFTRHWFTIHGSKGASTRIEANPTELRQLAYQLLSHAEDVEALNKEAAKHDQ